MYLSHLTLTTRHQLNASFGNAVELVVAIQALLANEIRVVQASMMGSIFSNLLLVLGCCFFFGGIRYQEQTFNTTAATANMSLLALSGIALVLPTPFAEYYEVQDEDVLIISRVAAIFLMFMYLQLLVFQLKTHVHLFEGDGGEEEATRVPFTVAIVCLFLATILVAVFSEYLVASIDGFVADSSISRTFIGLIILPVVGNAVEHLTAVSVAMKDKMGLAMSGTFFFRMIRTPVLARRDPGRLTCSRPFTFTQWRLDLVHRFPFLSFPSPSFLVGLLTFQ